VGSPRAARPRWAPASHRAPRGARGGRGGGPPVDQAAPAVTATPGGSVAARRRLDDFLARRLAGYDDSRSEPAPPESGHQSGLSPYLHFGHLSIEEVVERALVTTRRWAPMELEPRLVGKRSRFSNP